MATEKAVRFIKSHLEDAIAAEKSFETQLRGFASEGSSDQIHALFSQHADETRTQYERLTKRLTELGNDIPEIGQRGARPLGDLVRSENARWSAVLSKAASE